MESKFVTFLAFASLVRSSSTLTLSEDQSAIISQIKDNQRASIAAYSDGFKPFFDRLDALAAKLAFDLKAKTHDDPERIISDGLLRAKNAVDLSFDSVLLVLQGEFCSAVQPARRAAHYDLDDVFIRITDSLELADYGNTDAIEVHKAAVQRDFANLVKRFYDTICVCLDVCNDAEALAIVKNAEDGSLLGLFHLANAVFNAIKEYSAAVAAGYADVTLVFDVENLRGKALVGIKNDAENRFSAIGTFYINSVVNRREILSRLDAIQYAGAVTANRFIEAIEVVFGTIMVYLRRVAFRFDDDGAEDFSRTDCAFRRSVAVFDAADVALFSALLVMYPNSSCAILKAQDEMFAAEEIGVRVFYDAIYAAAAAGGKNSSHTNGIIKRARKAIISLTHFYAGIFFNTVRNSESFDEVTAAEQKTLEEEAVRVDQIAANAMFDAIEILAKVTRAAKLSKDDFYAVRKLLVTSSSAIDGFTENVAAGFLTTLKTCHVKSNKTIIHH